MRSMARLRGAGVVLAVILVAAPARGQYRETLLVDEATVVFQEIATIPEAGIPQSLLLDAQGFAILPGVIKAGFIVGGRHGRGVVVVRDGSGAWSNPVLVTLTGGGVGFQAGAQATDLILVFRSRGSIDSFLRGRGQFTLGADAAVAAGPVGRQVAAGTDARLQAEILSYSRSRGLFAGVSLEGAALKVDWKSNVAYYGQVLPTSVILTQPDLPAPESAARLRAVLARMTAPVVMVPAQPRTLGPGLEPAPAPAAPEPLPPVGGTTRLQSAELPATTGARPRVIVSTPRTPGTATAIRTDPAATSPAPRVLTSTPTAPGAAPRGSSSRLAGDPWRGRAPQTIGARETPGASVAR